MSGATTVVARRYIECAVERADLDPAVHVLLRAEALVSRIAPAGPGPLR